MMRLQLAVIAASLLQPASATPAGSLEERQVVNTPCHQVHIFVARGSYEGYDLSDNRQDNLVVPAVCKGRSSCGYEDIVYPATIGDDYCGSETQGVDAGLSQLKAYASRCPGSKLVLTGYSQGAQLVGDMLGGGGDGSCDAGNGPLSPSTSPGSRIVAVTLFGDTRRTANQPYDHGTAGAAVSGVFPRTGALLTNINKYKGKLASYCNTEDTYCASGNNGTAHAVEVETYWPKAAAFINKKL